MFMPNNAHSKIYFILLQLCPAINDELVKMAWLTDQILHYCTWGCIKRKWIYRQCCVIRGSLRKLFNVNKCSKILIYIYSLFLLFLALYFGGNENILAKNVYIYFRRPWSTIAPTNAKINQKHNLLRAYFVRVAANKNRILVIIKVQKRKFTVIYVHGKERCGLYVERFSI